MVYLPAKRDGVFCSTRDLANHRRLVSTTLNQFRKADWLTIRRPRGSATKKSPSNGWDDPRVGVYFGQQAQYSLRTPTRALPTQTATPRSTPVPPPGKKSNIGAIAGGTVGGFAALTLAIAIIFFYLRKRKRNQPAHAAPMPAPVNTDVSSV
jgi:hypothetical protein